MGGLGMDFESLKKQNNHLEMKLVTDNSFRKYGKVLDNYDFSELMQYMEDKTSIPEEGNIYVASVEDMEKFQINESLQNGFYAEMPIEIGYCNGKNSALNGLEYHKGSEIDVAVTDLVLLLGMVQDIENNQYESAKVEAFFVPKGTAVELYATALHFSPCKVCDEGFKCVVVLPRGTNLPLKKNEKDKGEGELLFTRNKWLLVHPSRKVLVDKGAHIGIMGENIEVKY